MLLDWQVLVTKAVQEVLNHPKGGRVDIHVFSDSVDPRRKNIVIEPLLVGIRKKRTVVNIDDD